MSKNIYLILFLFMCVFFVNRADARNKVVYGTDDRQDLYQLDDTTWLRLAQSTAAMIDKKNVTKTWWSSVYTISAETLQEGGVCSSERFSNQITAANCSGFLLGEDILVTAGHCAQAASDCGDYYWVFDYRYYNDEGGEIKVTPANVYECKEIIHAELDNYSQNDFAIIRLDRVVEGRTPLQYRQSGKIADGEQLVVMGHPSGLPLKVASNAWVRDNSDEIFFVTNLDTFGGNSGSAVFNAKTGVVEGILVRGENDYNYDYSSGCQRVYTCQDSSCRGEDVTRITNLKEILSQVLKQDDEVGPSVQDNELRFLDLALAIPDRDSVEYEFTVAASATKALSLALKITHTYVGDLKIELMSPSGKVITLRDRQGGSADDIDESYSLEEFDGEVVAGTWALIISDEAYFDKGVLSEIVFTFAATQGTGEEDEDEDEDESCAGIWARLEKQGAGEEYSSAVGLCGEEFKKEIKKIISVNKNLSYSKARKYMFEQLDNEDGQVCSVYSSNCIETSGIPNANVMNCEHSWPQSLGATGEARSDLHHLFPAMSDMNSRRGNLPFCEVVTVIYQAESLVGYNDQNVRCFEPRDVHKGDVARAMLYFAVRYGKSVDASQEAFFRQWNEQDLVSEKELKRNKGIEQVQKNRNPFVDYPLMVKLISDF